MEQEARMSRESMDPGIELPTMRGQSESAENEAEDQESAHARET